MKAWIWKDKYDTDMGLQFDIAASGFRLRGMEVFRYGTSKWVLKEMQPGDVFYGIASEVHRLGLPQISDYPAPLNQYMIPNEIMSFEEANEKEFPFFIKPVSHKKFTGLVAKSEMSLAFIEGNPQVYVAEALEIYSEWRTYVLNGRPLKTCHYSGEPLTFPQGDGIQAMIDAYDNSPSAYALDVAMTEDGMKFIEVNDVFCLGNYGLDSALFAQMLEARWEEIWSSGWEPNV